MDSLTLSPAEQQALINWVFKQIVPILKLDSLPLSRPNQTIEKDFHDGILVCQIINYYFPKFLDMTQFNPTSKQANWNSLNSKVLEIMINEKVFKKLGFQITANEIDSIIAQKSPSIYQALKLLSKHIEAYIEQMKDQQISDLKETVEILQLKINKLEHLLQLKDSKVQALVNQIQQLGIK